MEKETKSYDVDKLNELKKRIEERELELLDEINNALINKDDSSYNHLKQLQLQCRAELRLINHIENNLAGDFLIC